MQIRTSQSLPSVPFTRSTAHHLGITDRQLAAAVTDGVVRRLFRGVYVDAMVELTVELRAAALSLVVPKHAIVCDRVAAWLHGVDVYGSGDRDLVMPLELCSLRGCSRTRRPQVDGRVRDLQPHDVMRIGGVLVTTPLRTALDVGCGLTRIRALAALDAFRHQHGVSLEELQLGVTRFRRRRGVVQLRQLVPLTDPRSESPRESATRLMILEACLPTPTPQWWVEVDGVLRFRLDLAYPHLRVAIEYDGRDFHDRNDEQRQYDAQRRAWLRAHGWTVIVVNADSLFSGEDDGWVRELKDALRSRTKRLRWSRRV